MAELPSAYFWSDPGRRARGCRATVVSGAGGSFQIAYRASGDDSDDDIVARIAQMAFELGCGHPFHDLAGNTLLFPHCHRGEPDD